MGNPTETEGTDMAKKQAPKKQIKKIDIEELKALEATLTEWFTDNDDKAYCSLCEACPEAKAWVQEATKGRQKKKSHIPL